MSYRLFLILLPLLAAFPSPQSGGGGQDPEKCKCAALESFGTEETQTAVIEGQGNFSVTAANPEENDTYRGKCLWAMQSCSSREDCDWDYDIDITIGVANTGVKWIGRVIAPDGLIETMSASQTGGQHTFSFASDEASAFCRIAGKEAYLAEVKVEYQDENGNTVWSSWTAIGWGYGNFPCDRCYWQPSWDPPTDD